MLDDYGTVFNLACFLNDADYSESQGGSSTAVAVSLAACFSNRCVSAGLFFPSCTHSDGDGLKVCVFVRDLMKTTPWSRFSTVHRPFPSVLAFHFDILVICAQIKKSPLLKKVEYLGRCIIVNRRGKSLICLENVVELGSFISDWPMNVKRNRLTVL